MLPLYFLLTALIHFCEVIPPSTVPNPPLTDDRFLPVQARVVNPEGAPIPNARVKFFAFKYRVFPMIFQLIEQQEQTSCDSGDVSYRLLKPDWPLEDIAIMLLAQKEGFALSWASPDFRSRRNLGITITMRAAKGLGGTVVDEKNQAIAGAAVRIAVLFGPDPLADDDRQFFLNLSGDPLLQTSTDDKGRFSFPNLPEDSRIDLIVSAPGKGRVVPQSFAPDQFPYRAGDESIKITLAPAARLHGTALNKATGEPVKNLLLLISQNNDLTRIFYEPVKTDSRGAFELAGLAAGDYRIEPLLRPETDPSDKWFSQETAISLKEGASSEPVKLLLVRGGLLEVKLTDKETGEPLPGAKLQIFEPMAWQFRTDGQGLARARLAPGDYNLLHISFDNQNPPIGIQQRIAIKENETTRLDLKVVGPVRLTGVVRDPNGAPLPDAVVRVFPNDRSADAKTDNAGKYRILGPRGGGDQVVFAFHSGRNLATLASVDTKLRIKDFTLAPASILAGKVTDPNGGEIAEAKVIVYAACGNLYGRTDKQGNFHIGGVPDDPNFRLPAYSVSSPGKTQPGPNRERILYLTAESDDFGRSPRVSVTHFSPGAINQVETIILKPAHKKVEGVVVDENDQPVAGARVSLGGALQKDLDTRADNKGRFTFEQVCSGPTYIHAVVGQYPFKRGQINLDISEAARVINDARIVIPLANFLPEQVVRTGSLLNRPLPDLKGLGLTGGDVGTLEKRGILLCFWDIQQRPSRNAVKELAGKLPALESAGVKLVLVQATPVEKTILQDYLAELKLTCLVCQITADEERTQAAWGVQSLPWLILADPGHKVKAEGFAVTEVENLAAGSALR